MAIRDMHNDVAARLPPPLESLPSGPGTVNGYLVALRRPPRLDDDHRLFAMPTQLSVVVVGYAAGIPEVWAGIGGDRQDVQMSPKLVEELPLRGTIERAGEQFILEADGQPSCGRHFFDRRVDLLVKRQEIGDIVRVVLEVGVDLVAQREILRLIVFRDSDRTIRECLADLLVAEAASHAFGKSLLEFAGGR